MTTREIILCQVIIFAQIVGKSFNKPSQGGSRSENKLEESDPSYTDNSMQMDKVNLSLTRLSSSSLKLIYQSDWSSSRKQKVVEIKQATN